MIESNDSFGVTIHFRDTPEVEQEKAEELEAEKMQGGYKSDEEQNASLKVARKIGLDSEETEQMIRDREAIVAKVQTAILQRKKGGRPPKVKKEQETHV